jgi:hypothetical protein
MRQALDRITLADLLQHEGLVTELLRARLAEAVLERAAPLVPLGPLSARQGVAQS